MKLATASPASAEMLRLEGVQVNAHSLAHNEMLRLLREYKYHRMRRKLISVSQDGISSLQH